MPSSRPDAAGRQPSVAALLGPKWRSAVAPLRRRGSGTPAKTVMLALGTALLWLVVLAITVRVLRVADQAQGIGAVLPGKVLAMVLLSFGLILLLSNVITALSTFFLARDLDLLACAPVDWLRIYLAKLIESGAHASWMVLLLAIPVLAGYGVALDGGPLYPLVALAALLPYLAVPAAVGGALTLLLVNVFPARRTRDILSLVAIGAAGLMVVMLRFVQPERLARPEGYASLVDFLAAMRAPTSPWLPSEWCAWMLMNWLRRIADPLPPALLYSTAAACVTLGAALQARWYRRAFSMAQESVRAPARADAVSRGERLLAWLPAAPRAVLLKDGRLFFRDPTQWSQLILIGVLLIVYIFNIRALPLRSGEQLSQLLVTVVVFLNQGLAGFVLAAITARFVFPAVSLEGRTFWLLRSTPLRPATLFWCKFGATLLPLLAIAVGLVLLTDRMLEVRGFMLALNLCTIAGFTVAASALALAFGTVYPQFGTENAAQIPTSFGGLLYMLTAVALLVVLLILEARPVLAFVEAQHAGELVTWTPDLLLSLGLAGVLCAGVTAAALHIGVRDLARLEH